MAALMPYVTLTDGRTVQVPAKPDGTPDWGVVGQLAPSPSAAGPRLIPRQDFIGRLGLTHLAQIIAASANDPALGALVLRVQTAGEMVDLDAPDTITGLGLLQSRGILTAAEVAAVRA